MSDFARLSQDIYLPYDKLHATLEKAEKGDAEATFKLARHYSIIRVDLLSANYWLKRAASLGHPIALYNYAISCLDPDDMTMPNDESLGISLLEQAKEKGHQKAIDLLTELRS